MVIDGTNLCSYAQACRLSSCIFMSMHKIGNSSTNSILLMGPYFFAYLVYMQRYKRDLDIGSLMSIVLPISVSFLAIWTVFLLA